MKTASVIMPAYNSERFIEHAMKSVLDQGLDEFELIVVDDGSVDSTRDIVRSMQSSHPNIKLFSNERTKGPSGARNTGLLHATGDYICFLDSDDLWCPDHLSKSIKRCEEHSIDLIFNDFSVVDFEKNEEMFNWFSNKQHLRKIKAKSIGEGLFLVEGDLVEGLLNESFIHLQAMVGKRMAFNGILFNEELTRAEDTDFCIRLFKGGASFAYSDDITSIYHRHDKSITAIDINNYIAIVECELRLFSEYYRDKIFFCNRGTLRGRLLELFLDHAFWMRRKGRYKDAMLSTFKAARYGINPRVVIESCKIVAAFFLSLVGNEKRENPS